MGSTKRKPTRLEKRRRAREIYLQRGGEITMDELSKLVHVSRESLGKFRRQDKWDTELEAVRDAVKARAVDLVADSAEEAFSRHLKNLERLDDQIERKLSGELSPVEIGHLTRAAATIVQTSRLLNGQSTANTAVDARVSQSTQPGSAPGTASPSPFEQIVDHITKSGDETGQRILMQLAESFQELMAYPEERHNTDTK